MSLSHSQSKIPFFFILFFHNFFHFSIFLCIWNLKWLSQLYLQLIAVILKVYFVFSYFEFPSLLYPTCYFFYSSFSFLFYDRVIMFIIKSELRNFVSWGIPNSLTAACKYIWNVRRKSWQILIAVDTDRLDFSFENMYCMSSGDADHRYAHVCRRSLFKFSRILLNGSREVLLTHCC